MVTEFHRAYGGEFRYGFLDRKTAGFDRAYELL